MRASCGRWRGLGRCGASMGWDGLRRAVALAWGAGQSRAEGGRGTGARRNASALCEWGLTRREDMVCVCLLGVQERSRDLEAPCARALDSARLWSLLWGIARPNAAAGSAPCARVLVTAYRVASRAAERGKRTTGLRPPSGAGRGSRSHHTLTWPTPYASGLRSTHPASAPATSSFELEPTGRWSRRLASVSGFHHNGEATGRRRTKAANWG